MTLSWFTALRQTLLTRLAAGVGGILALGVVTAQTVINAMPSQSLPSVAAGQQFEAGRWRITPIGAALSSAPRPNGYAPKGVKSLSIDLELLNRTSESSNAYGRILKIDPAIAGLQADPTFYLMRDNAILGALHPGLPERVRVVWSVSEQAEPPSSVRLTIAAETFKPRDNLFAAPGWFNAKTIAVVTLPVRMDVSTGATP